MTGLGMGLGLPEKPRELGRLRTGMKVAKVNKQGKEVTFPTTLTEWRLTTKSRWLAEHVADVYGGDVHQWLEAPSGSGIHWEVFTKSDTLEVFVPDDALSQSWELWQSRNCLRRCNGTAMSTGEVCQCPADLEERLYPSKEQKEAGVCKPTSRLSVILYRLPDVGVWRVDAHGEMAAREWPATVRLLDNLRNRGDYLRTKVLLRIDQRAGKDGHFYSVPVLELPKVTIAQMLDGVQPVAAIGAAPAALNPGRTVDESEAQDDDEDDETVTVADLIERVNALPAVVRGDCVKDVRAKVGMFPKVPPERMDEAVAIVEGYETRPEPPPTPQAPQPSPEPAASPPDAPQAAQTADPEQVRTATEALAADLGKQVDKAKSPPSFPGDPRNFWQPAQGPRLPLGVKVEFFDGPEAGLSAADRKVWDQAWLEHPGSMGAYVTWHAESEGRTPPATTAPLFTEADEKGALK